MKLKTSLTKWTHYAASPCNHKWQENWAFIPSGILENSMPGVKLKSNCPTLLKVCNCKILFWYLFHLLLAECSHVGYEISNSLLWCPNPVLIDVCVCVRVCEMVGACMCVCTWIQMLNRTAGFNRTVAGHGSIQLSVNTSCCHVHYSLNPT